MSSTHPGLPAISKCPLSDSTRCRLQCKYNHFAQDGLTIDAWELRCLECGYRDTRAFRSDDQPPATQPTHCPFCALADPTRKINPCVS